MDCFKPLVSQVATDGGCERDLVHKINEGYKARGALKSVFSSRRLGINAKCPYEGEIIVLTPLYGAEAWGMRSAERREINILEMNCLWNLVEATGMNSKEWKFAYRSGIEMELASRVDQRVLRWFGHVEKMNEYRMARKVLKAGTG